MEANLCAYCKRQTRFPLHGCVAADGSSLCCNYYVLPLLTVLYAVFHALLVLCNSPFGVVKKNCARPSFQRLRLYFSCVLLGCTIRLFSNCCTFTQPSALCVVLIQRQKNQCSEMSSLHCPSRVSFAFESRIFEPFPATTTITLGSTAVCSMCLVQVPIPSQHAMQTLFLYIVASNKRCFTACTVRLSLFVICICLKNY